MAKKRSRLEGLREKLQEIKRRKDSAKNYPKKGYINSTGAGHLKVRKEE